MSMTVLPKMTDKQHKAAVGKAVKKITIKYSRTGPVAEKSRGVSDAEIRKAVDRFSKVVVKTARSTEK